MFGKYYESVKYLESLNNLPQAEYMREEHGRNFYLKRTANLIGLLKINLKQFKFIHIAGTSGKGSVTAMLHSALNQAGKKIGSFSSPHPTTSIERIKVGSKYISPNDFVRLLNKIKPIIDKMYINNKYGLPSYFEIFFALAILYFKEKKCEYVILETGCGGQFDATNIIKRPIITAITNVGYDHMQLLGKTLTKIAHTKAGIIKRGSKFITTEQRSALLKIFQQICLKKKSQFIALPAKQMNSADNNIVLASRIAEKLKIEKKIIQQAIGQTKLSCRFEIIQTKPMVILDGAHNYDKIKSTCQNLKKINFRNLFFIFTLNENKQIAKIIKMLGNQLKNSTQIYLTRHLVAERTCANLKSMYNLFPSAHKKNISIYIDPWQALDQALKKTRQNDLILITGSFYLAGELRKKWVNEITILSTSTG